MMMLVISHGDGLQSSEIYTRSLEILLQVYIYLYSEYEMRAGDSRSIEKTDPKISGMIPFYEKRKKAVDSLDTRIEKNRPKSLSKKLSKNM